MSRRPFTLDRVFRLFLSAVIITAVLLLVIYLKGVLLPFVVAMLIAYILEPLVQINRSVLHLRGRIIAVFSTLFEITTIICILSYFCIPSIFDEMQQMARLIKEYTVNGAHTPLLPDFVHEYIRSNVDLIQIAEKFAKQDLSLIIQKSFSIVSGGISFLLSVIDWLLMFIYILFIMLDYDNLIRGFKLLVPPQYRLRVFRLWGNVKISMDHYFRGQALIALIIAVLYSIGFSIIGLPLAIVIGMTIGVLFMIPYMQYITVIPVTILCILYSVDSDVSFWTIWWECIALYALNEVLANLILTPKILGKAMGLNPAIILLSLSIWGTLLGIIGMIIALPMTTLIISYYNNYLIKHENARLKAEQSQMINDFAKLE